MRTIEISKATGSLAKYTRSVRVQPMIIVEAGRAIAALVPLDHADQETLSLSTNRQFLALIERSRSRQASEGGLSSTQMRKRLKKRRAR